MRASIPVLMAAIVCGGGPARAMEVSPPTGWREPTAAELSREPLRGNLPTKYVEAKADFDGDGKEDQAAIFIAGDGKGEGLFVRLSSVNASKWTQVETVVHPPATGPVMGITIAKPGVFQTTCGKGYSKCRSDEPASVELKYAGIDFFKFESASSIVYWDAGARTFKRVWTSD